MKILFTGGGSAGHVTPNLGLIERFLREGWRVSYIGSAAGIERQIVAGTGIEYHAVASGKLRRYFNWQNFIDPLRILLGIIQSTWLCRRIAPDVVFSKGGFIAVPVVIGAWLNRIPVVIHESDVTPGLANRICIPLATRICVTFPQTLQLVRGERVLLSGTPVRESVRAGDADAGRRFLGFDAARPILLFFGGSLGAATINRCVHASLERLLERYQVAHICGAGNLERAVDARTGYRQLEYLHQEFGDVLACADLVISRAGANSLYELLICRKPHILIPLGREASRGDQLDNARTFADLGMSRVLYEDALSAESLMTEIASALADRDLLVRQMDAFATPDSVSLIHDLLVSLAPPA